jgi:hypothetical protein
MRERTYDGFAFFGDLDLQNPGEVMPIVDAEAHEHAEWCGLQKRSPHQYGTTILIVDCEYDTEQLKTASEIYWWPRLIRDELDVVFYDEDKEYNPRPKNNSQIKPFITCWQNIVSDSAMPPKTQLFRAERRIGTTFGPLQPGILSAVLLESECERQNTVALMRGPGMVVKYHPCGTDAFEPCAGVFIAHSDVEKILTFSEPQMHNDWDENSDRLTVRYPEDGERVVRLVKRRIEQNFRDFQRRQEPPIPPGG